MRHLIFAALLMMISHICCDRQPTTQTVDGNGKDIHADTISSDQFWSASSPHIIDGDLYIHHAVIRIESGATVRLKNGASINIMEAGGLIADGQDEQIIFTRDSDEDVWKYIFFARNSIPDSCFLINCRIEYGGGDANWPAMVYCQESSPEIRDTEIRASASGGLYLSGHCQPVNVLNNMITENAEEPIMTAAVNIPFISEGNYQGNASNYVKVVSGAVNADAEWPDLGLPYRISDDLLVKKSSLTLRPGTELHFDANTGMELSGGSRLIAVGSNDSIIFKGMVPVKGYWNGLTFNGSSGSELMNCLIAHGGADPMSPANVTIDKASPSFLNCGIESGSQYGLIVTGTYSPDKFEGVSITSNCGPPISTPAVNVHILGRAQCVSNLDNVIEVTGGDILASIFWEFRSIPLKIKNSIKVKGAILHLDANLTLMFESNASVEIREGGGLIADGASGLITFTGSNRTPGAWGCIDFGDGCLDASCLLNDCLIEYGGGDQNRPANIYCDNASPTISNCVVANSRSYGVYLSGNSNPQMSDNLFQNNPDGSIFP
jgi:parallel beta-helix repeat protein